MDGSLLSRYTAARQSGSVQKGGRGKIFIIVGVLLIISVLVSVFSGVIKLGGKEKVEPKETAKPKPKESTGDADVNEDVEYAYIVPDCEMNKKIQATEGNLGACNSVFDIDPVGVTFSGTYFKPRAPIRGNSWIHELSSNDDTKEYIAAHQSKDNLCKMVRFHIKKDADVCRYKQLDARYVPSSKEQGKSVCTNAINVLDSWNKGEDVPIASSDDEGGYGIQKMKYHKFCS
jgi:hypothetical protein